MRNHDELVYIPMSSALSGSCATAEALAEDYDGRVSWWTTSASPRPSGQSVLDAAPWLGRA